MIKRIEIINFMSHAHTVIEPADGLTVIVGDNNTGKSALVSALQVLCRNAPGDYMIRHGERECRIRILTDDGHEIEWARKGKVVSYRINGRDVHRLGGSVPDDLHELLRLPLVEMESDPFDIHFGEQKKPIFLLNDSSSRRATFFASSSDTIKLIEMQGRHRRKIQETRAVESGLARREEALVQQLDRLAPVDLLEQDIAHLEAEYEQIFAGSNAIKDLARSIRVLETATAEMTHWAASAEAMQDLEPPPPLEDAAAVARLIGRIQEQHHGIEREAGRISAAACLTPVPQLVDTQPLAGWIRKMEHLRGQVDISRGLRAAIDPLAPPPCLAELKGLSRLIEAAGKLSARCRKLDAKAGELDLLENPPAMANPEPLNRLIETLSAARLEWQAAQAARSSLDELPVPPATADDPVLVSLMEQLASSLEACRRLEVETGKIREEQEAARAALTACVEATGVCPTCGQDLDPEQFVERMPLAGEANR